MTPNCSIYIEDRGNYLSQIMCILILCTVSQPTVNWEVCVLTFTCYLFRRIPYKGAILNCDVIQLFELRPSILHHLTSTGQYSQSQVSADLAWFPAPRGRGKECCLCMRHQVPMITCILHCYTKIMTNFILPAERPYCRAMLFVQRLEGFEVRNYIAWR